MSNLIIQLPYLQYFDLNIDPLNKDQRKPLENKIIEFKKYNDSVTIIINR